MEILLNEELHQYTVDGTVKPSVTEILNEWLLVDGWYVNIYRKDANGEPLRVPKDAFEGAGGFGRAFHKGANFIVNGKKVKYPPEMETPFSELRRWRTEYAIETVASEMKIYCPKLDVAGTLDWIGYLSPYDDKVLNLVDWKTSKYNLMVGPQTFAYEQGYRARTGYRGIIKRWAWIYDKARGEYKFVELQDSIGDEYYFKSMNFSHRWRRR